MYVRFPKSSPTASAADPFALYIFLIENNIYFSPRL